ncbi:MAG TPA: hypothetical protein VEG63_09350 [Candidatus Acidoferrales bacterium]|nr:hypothetical protein [Candidatus Acidoferrales bacterium]
MPSISHFAAMTLFAAAASATLAFHSRPTNRERLIYALKTFVMFVGGAILIAWLLYPISR